MSLLPLNLNRCQLVSFLGFKYATIASVDQDFTGEAYTAYSFLDCLYCLRIIARSCTCSQSCCILVSLSVFWLGGYYSLLWKSIVMGVFFLEIINEIHFVASYNVRLLAQFHISWTTSILHSSNMIVCDMPYESTCAFAGVQPLSARRYELGRRFFRLITQSDSCLHDLLSQVPTACFRNSFPASATLFTQYH